MQIMKTIKKAVPIVLCAAMSLSIFYGCGSNKANDNSGKKKVAIVQLVDNDAFTQMIDSFKAKMNELGYTDENTTFETFNAQGDNSNLNSIAANVKSKNYDLIVPIVTPATQAVVNQNPTSPVVFISVTNPVGAGIMSDMKKPDKNATGTSNIIPVDEIFSLTKKLTPDVKKIGILYCKGETNAVQTVKKAKEYLDSSKEFTYEETTVTNSSEVTQAATLLASKVDAIYVPIDSTVQSAMPSVVEAATKNNIPVYGSDPVMVKSGALGCVSVSNKQLGEKSAEMADKILKGSKVSDVESVALTDYQYVLSKKTADTLKITIPDDSKYIVMDK